MKGKGIEIQQTELKTSLPANNVKANKKETSVGNKEPPKLKLNLVSKTRSKSEERPSKTNSDPKNTTKDLKNKTGTKENNLATGNKTMKDKKDQQSSKDNQKKDKLGKDKKVKDKNKQLKENISTGQENIKEGKRSQNVQGKHKKKGLNDRHDQQDGSKENQKSGQDDKKGGKGKKRGKVYAKDDLDIISNRKAEAKREHKEIQTDKSSFRMNNGGDAVRYRSKDDSDLNSYGKYDADSESDFFRENEFQSSYGTGYTATTGSTRRSFRQYMTSQKYYALAAEKPPKVSSKPKSRFVSCDFETVSNRTGLSRGDTKYIDIQSEEDGYGGPRYVRSRFSRAGSRNPTSMSLQNNDYIDDDDGDDGVNGDRPSSKWAADRSQVNGRDRPPEDLSPGNTDSIRNGDQGSNDAKSRVSDGDDNSSNMHISDLEESGTHQVNILKVHHQTPTASIADTSPIGDTNGDVHTSIDDVNNTDTHTREESLERRLKALRSEASSDFRQTERHRSAKFPSEVMVNDDKNEPGEVKAKGEYSVNGDTLIPHHNGTLNGDVTTGVRISGKSIRPQKYEREESLEDRRRKQKFPSNDDETALKQKQQRQPNTGRGRPPVRRFSQKKTRKSEPKKSEVAGASNGLQKIPVQKQSNVETEPSTSLLGSDKQKKAETQNINNEPSATRTTIPDDRPYPPEHGTKRPESQDGRYSVDSLEGIGLTPYKQYLNRLRQESPETVGKSNQQSDKQTDGDTNDNGTRQDSLERPSAPTEDKNRRYSVDSLDERNRSSRQQYLNRLHQDSTDAVNVHQKHSGSPDKRREGNDDVIKPKDERTEDISQGAQAGSEDDDNQNGYNYGNYDYGTNGYTPAESTNINKNG